MVLIYPQELMEKAIMQKKHINKGSITIEAAIILPLFFLALLAMALIIRMISLEEQITFVSLDEAKHVATSAYNQEGQTAETIIEAALRLRVNKRLGEEVNLNGSGYITNFSYRYKDYGLTDLISYSIEYQRKFPIPFYQNQDRWGTRALTFRGFVGRSEEEFLASEELEEEDFIVWVFPVAGERYHLETCPHIRVLPRQTMLTEGIKSSYRPCKHCKPEKLSTGNMVYIFPATGEVYHRGSCFLVDRYVISMEKSVAEQKGYTPCRTCIGGRKHE